MFFMRWRATVRTTLAAGIVILAAGCSTGPADTSTDTSPDTTPVTPTAPSSTTAPTPTTSAATLPPPAATTTTTTTPGDATTTSTEPEDLEASVRAAYEHRYQSYWACLRSPHDCDLSYLLPGSPAEINMREGLIALVNRDRYVGPDDVGYYKIDSIAFDVSGAEATVTACWWSTAVLYGAPVDSNRDPGPDNPPTVVADTPVGARQADLLVRSGGTWLFAEGTPLDSGYAEDPCG